MTKVAESTRVVPHELMPGSFSRRRRARLRVVSFCCNLAYKPNAPKASALSPARLGSTSRDSRKSISILTRPRPSLAHRSRLQLRARSCLQTPRATSVVRYTEELDGPTRACGGRGKVFDSKKDERRRRRGMSRTSTSSLRLLSVHRRATESLRPQMAEITWINS